MSAFGGKADIRKPLAMSASDPCRKSAADFGSLSLYDGKVDGGQPRVGGCNDTSIYGCSCRPRCVSASAARSDQYPTLNTAPVCHGITEQSDLETGLFQTSFDQCMKEEQAVRDTMIKEWAGFASDDKTHCVAEATMGGDSSYTELLTCLEMARDVRQLHSAANSSSAPAQQVPPAPVGHRQPTLQ